VTYQKIFENVVVLGWDQWLVADYALEHPVTDTRLGLHPNNFVTRLAARAGEIAGMIALHDRTLYQICDIG
jgi:hypothetical protein